MVNLLLWLGQAFLAIIFLYSGLMKSTKTERELVAMGQTGVEHLPLALIRFIGLAELLGVVGLFVPLLVNRYTGLASLAAIGLGLIMIPAALIHYRRGEKKTACLNGLIFLICLLVAYGRGSGVI
ncbi:DoxX family protein [Larkinella ripae]